MINIEFTDAVPTGVSTLAIVATKDDLGALSPEQVSLATRDLAVAVAGREGFDGAAGSLVSFYMEGEGGPRRILLVGAGAGEYEQAGAAIAAHLLTSGDPSATILLAQESAEAAAQTALGAVLRGWRYDVYRTKLKEKARISLERLSIVGGGAGAPEVWRRHQAIAEGVAFARTLVTEPGNMMYPASFVERCASLADLGVVMEILDEEAMRALGMGALLGVSQGSPRAPRLLCMRWKGSDADPVALVGKGVTFDTGGISIKPAAGMEEMKWDMGGAAAVAGTMKSLALRKAKAHVIGICGLVENMPDGNAQRPGDVVTSMSGQTVEVINTDCEGRLVLCDVLTWVQKTHGPKTIIDLATLTGAIVVSLGNHFGGLFANDDKLAEQLWAAGAETGERLWRMPLDKAFDETIDSDIADVKNMGPRMGGASTAAHFLQRFIDDKVAWAHLDIAGMAWADKPGPLWGKGATGYGVRLLDRFIADTVER